MLSFYDFFIISAILFKINFVSKYGTFKNVQISKSGTGLKFGGGNDYRIYYNGDFKQKLLFVCSPLLLGEAFSHFSLVWHKATSMEHMRIELNAVVMKWPRGGEHLVLRFHSVFETNKWGISQDLSKNQLKVGTSILEAHISFLSCKKQSRGVMVKLLESGLAVSEFKLQPWYCIHFLTNTLGKGIEAPSLKKSLKAFSLS